MKSLLISLLRKLYKVSVAGEENLEALKQHLAAGSAIVVFNHLTMADPLLVWAVIAPFCDRQIKRALAPASRKHWGRPIVGWVMRLAPLLGLQLAPIVQHYERGLYSQAYALKLDLQFVRLVLKTLAARGGIVLLAPEGHRSEDGGLQPARKGITFLLGLSQEKGFAAKVFPVGIIPEQGAGRGLNLGKRFVLNFGGPASPAEIMDRAIMEMIAGLLPGGQKERA